MVTVPAIEFQKKGKPGDPGGPPLESSGRAEDDSGDSPVRVEIRDSL
jgi:hypothetical protein